MRKESEYLSEHALAAINTSLDYINDHLLEFLKKGYFYVHYDGGYRRMIRASILKSRGIHNLVDVKGGFKDMSEVGIPRSEYVCPSTI